MSVTWVDSRSGYVPGAVNVGVVRLNGDDALIVDAGLDDDRAKKVISAVEREGLRPATLFLTHAHADHMGGARLLTRRTEVRVATSAGEAAFARNPYLEPYALFGLAEPPADLQTKFLMAEPVKVDEELNAGPWKPDGNSEITVVDLSGHAPWQCGLIVGDVCFCGDALFPTDLWEKHRFVYQADVARTFASFDRLVEISAGTVVPAHGEPLSPADDAIEGNRQHLLGLSRHVLGTVQRGVEEGGWGTEALVRALAEDWGLGFRSLVDFSLARATVSAHLSYLAHHGSVRARADGGSVRWLPTG